MNEAIVYLDSSALLKLIFDEPESDTLNYFLRGWPTRVSSALARIEVSRIAARVADTIVQREARRVLRAVHLIRVDDDIVLRAATMGPPALRSPDAIHLATAELLGSDLAGIVAYDRRLARAAGEHGLTVWGLVEMVCEGSLLADRHSKVEPAAHRFALLPGRGERPLIDRREHNVIELRPALGSTQQADAGGMATLRNQRTHDHDLLHRTIPQLHWKPRFHAGGHTRRLVDLIGLEERTDCFWSWGGRWRSRGDFDDRSGDHTCGRFGSKNGNSRNLARRLFCANRFTGNRLGRYGARRPCRRQRLRPDWRRRHG